MRWILLLMVTAMLSGCVGEQAVPTSDALDGYSLPSGSMDALALEECDALRVTYPEDVDVIRARLPDGFEPILYSGLGWNGGLGDQGTSQVLLARCTTVLLEQEHVVRLAFHGDLARTSTPRDGAVQGIAWHAVWSDTRAFADTFPALQVLIDDVAFSGLCIASQSACFMEGSVADFQIQAHLGSAQSDLTSAAVHAWRVVDREVVGTYSLSQAAILGTPGPTVVNDLLGHGLWMNFRDETLLFNIVEE